MTMVSFNTMHSYMRICDLVQEQLAYRVSPVKAGWCMLEPKRYKYMKHEIKLGILVMLPFEFKFMNMFKKPCTKRLECIEVMCNKILANFIVEEDRSLTTAFND